MEIVVIIILAVAVSILLGVFLRDRSRRRYEMAERGEELSRVVGEKLEDNVKMFGDVREKLGELTQRTRDIQEVGRNIASLQELLKAPKFRGCFGELLLERLLADVLPSNTYSLQHRFRDGRIVDAVVQIGKNMVPVDSKFPLEDYDRMVKTEDEEERRVLRQQFLRTIRKHVDGVSKYILPDEGTFDFALMYIPAENVYYEAVIQGPRPDEGNDIYTYSLQRRVVPVSPNSFYAYLQVIVLGLKGLRFETAAQEILGYIGRLQGDIMDFERDYDVIGGHIRNAASKYETAGRKLDRFRERLRLAGESPDQELVVDKSKEKDTEKDITGSG